MRFHSQPIITLPTLDKGHDPVSLFYYYDLTAQTYHTHTYSPHNYWFWSLYALTHLQPAAFLNDINEDFVTNIKITQYPAIEISLTTLSHYEQNRFWRFLRRSIAKQFHLTGPIHAQYLILIQDQQPTYLSLEEPIDDPHCLAWVQQLIVVYQHIAKEDRVTFHRFLREGMEYPWYQYHPGDHPNTYLYEQFQTYCQLGSFNPEVPREYSETPLFLD